MSETYRVLTDRLRVQRGPGNPDLVVERPKKLINTGKNNERKVYADSEEEPTRVSFDELCRVNVAYLLRVGAIVPWEAPPEAHVDQRGTEDGEETP